jgi:hypothetical protein
MKVATSIKTAALTGRINEQQVRLAQRGLKIKTGIKAGGHVKFIK